MTDIRRRGFSNHSDFNDQMEEIDASDDNAFEPGQDRSDEIELAWLRKEVEGLREQLAIARGQALVSNPTFEDRDKRVRIVAVLTAALFCVVLATRV
jgi:hypothetical protein